MVKVNVYGADRKIIDSVDLSEQPTYNDPTCKHLHIQIVEDEMEGVTAYQCKDCMIGWLVKDKIKESKNGK
jgi:hypothetical protein